jgi:phosphate transport system substrate-binding protein
MKKILVFTILSLFYNLSLARDYIEIVGSSTVFPFSTVVAETFGKKTKFPTPKVEATGSGGGIKLFCKGNGIDSSDIVNSSRRIKEKEFQKCLDNGVTDITEVLIGFDGIAIANSKDGLTFDLTIKDLYLALAAKVPANIDQNAKKINFIKNPYTHWNQINAKLPAVKIKILGPPPTSGTRDALQELALEGGCKEYSFIKQLKKKNKEKYIKLCHTIREDGRYIEMGENDNLIISKLSNEINTLGIFGFSFLDQNSDKVKGAKINNNPITFEKITSGEYPISRPLYFYIKNSHRDKIKGINKFIAEFVNESTIGEEGYLTDKGLIPLPINKLKKYSNDALNSVKLEM